MQPTFNPWIGYFDLIDYVDRFVFLDSVQLARRSWQIRNKLKVNNQEYMFTVPIQKEKHRDELLIADAKISYVQFDFREKLLSLVKQNYKKAPFYDDLIDEIAIMIGYETEYLAQYNINFITSISTLLGFQTSFINSSELDEIKGSKGDLILDICQSLNTDTYVSPLGSKEYLQEHADTFKNLSIALEYQYYQHPAYQQLGKEFIPYLGILDLLFNEGVLGSKEVILKGRSFAK